MSKLCSPRRISDGFLDMFCLRGHDGDMRRRLKRKRFIEGKLRMKKMGCVVHVPLIKLIHLFIRYELNLYI